MHPATCSPIAAHNHQKSYLVECQERLSGLCPSRETPALGMPGVAMKQSVNGSLGAWTARLGCAGFPGMAVFRGLAGGHRLHRRKLFRAVRLIIADNTRAMALIRRPSSRDSMIAYCNEAVRDNAARQSAGRSGNRQMTFDGRFWDARLLGWAFSACSPRQPLVLQVRSSALDATWQRCCLAVAKGAYDVFDGLFPQRHCRIELS